MTTVTFPRASSTPLATVSQPAPEVWMLSMHNLPDNRLLPEFIKTALLPALDHIELAFHRQAEKGSKKGALVLVGETGVGKFFSNGLQLECLKEYPTFFRDYYYVLLSRLLTFPLPTVAAINGHCFAGGLCLALACDWRVCRPDRTWLSMNELLFGAPIPTGMSALLSARLSPPVLRKVLLTAHKYTAPEALAEGLVDEVAPEQGSGKCVERAVQRAGELKATAESGVLSAMKRTMYASTLAQLAQDEQVRLGGAQKDNAERFKALVQAEGMAKL
ncbi:hypothetical protein JCM10207_005540 [Rhodosporidiobolus poonsookiae]